MVVARWKTWRRRFEIWPAWNFVKVRLIDEISGICPDANLAAANFLNANLADVLNLAVMIAGVSCPVETVADAWRLAVTPADAVPKIYFLRRPVGNPPAS